MTARTLLARPPLRGPGTGQVQCLRSYLQHVAFSHSLKPRRVLELLVGQSPGLSMASGVSALGGADNIHTGNSGCAALRRALEAATGASLQEATLEDVASAFSMKRARGDQGIRYCPVCVQEETPDDELPYGRLLWELSFVEACPVHEVLLRSARTCGAPQHEHLSVQSRPSMDGVCHRCGSIGFRCISHSPEPAPQESVLIARCAERLLANRSQPGFTLSEDLLRQGIGELVHALYGGSVVRTATECGLSRGTVCMWLKGMRPSLAYCVQLSLRAGADITALCQGKYRRDESIRATAESLRISASYRRSNISTPQLKQLLLEAAASPQPPSLRAFGQANGLHVDAARNRAPIEAAALSQARQAFCQSRREKLVQSYVDRYTAAALELQRNGLTVHRRALEKASGLVAIGAGSRSDALMKVLATFSAKRSSGREAARRPVSFIAQELARLTESAKAR